jgi:uncharacterized membrane protein YgaE (UPF0421/DUF939 family)
MGYPWLQTALRPGGVNALVASCKATLGAVVAFVGFGLLGIPGAPWAAVSAVLVTQPTLHPSFRASLFRLGANFVGAAIGGVLVALMGSTVWTLALGVLLTGLACQVARLDQGLRSAYAAVVIVTLNQETSAWVGSLDRVLAVMFGCLCALLVGVTFDLLSRTKKTEPSGETSP